MKKTQLRGGYVRTIGQYNQPVYSMIDLVMPPQEAAERDDELMDLLANY